MKHYRFTRHGVNMLLELQETFNYIEETFPETDGKAFILSKARDNNSSAAVMRIIEELDINLDNLTRRPRSMSNDREPEFNIYVDRKQLESINFSYDTVEQLISEDILEEKVITFLEYVKLIQSQEDYSRVIAIQSAFEYWVSEKGATQISIINDLTLEIKESDDDIKKCIELKNTIWAIENLEALMTFIRLSSNK